MEKIIHVLSSNKFSGAENVAIFIIKSLKDQYKLFYSSKNGSIKEKLLEEDIDSYLIDNFRIREIKRILYKVKPNIVHAHDFKATVMMSLLKFIGFKFTLISHIHQDPKWIHKYGIKRIILKIFSINVDSFILVNKNINNKSFFENLKNKVILSNIVNVKEITKKSNEYNVEKADFIFIGRLIDVKNPLFLLEILKKYKEVNPQFKCYILGDGPLYNDCLEFIKNYNLTSNINLMGFVNNPYPYLLNSKILLMTSRTEGLPMVVNEAISLGKPIISTNIDGLKVFEETSFVFLCNNISEYINRIIELENNRIYDNVSNNAFKYAEINFDSNKYCEAIKKVYYKPTIEGGGK